MDWQTIEIAFVFAPVIVVFFGFVREKLPPDVAAMLATGILTADAALSVFGNGGPLTVGLPLDLLMWATAVAVIPRFWAL